MGFFGGGGAAPANMVGATSSTAGVAGLVPGPSAGEHKLTLRGDATFYPSQPIIYAPKTSFTHGAGAVNGSSESFWTYPWLAGGSGGPLATRYCYFCPILIPKQDTYNRLGITITTGAASSEIGLALYDNDEANNLPKNLLASSSSGISTASAATVEQTISVTLSAGWYHGAVLVSTSTTLAFRVENNYWFPFYGSTQPWGGTGRGTALQAYLTNQRSTVTDFPTSISSSDITIRVNGGTIGGTANTAMPTIGIRKV